MTFSARHYSGVTAYLLRPIEHTSITRRELWTNLWTVGDNGGSSVVTNIPLWWRMLRVEEGMGPRGVRGLLVLPAHFYCEPKIALLNSLFFKKKIKNHEILNKFQKIEWLVHLKHKTLLRGIKEDLSKWKDIPHDNV